jgi:hypothetical protein
MPTNIISRLEILFFDLAKWWAAPLLDNVQSWTKFRLQRKNIQWAEGYVKYPAFSGPLKKVNLTDQQAWDGGWFELKGSRWHSAAQVGCHN